MSTGQVDFLSTPEGLGQTSQQTPQQVFVKPHRSMAGFVADAVVSEEHEDELEITDHPVEQGSVISDHAYSKPSWVRLVYGWSAGSPQADNDPQFLQTLYQKLLALRTNRTLFDVYTSKRKYSNMVLKLLRTDSTRQTENSMFVTAMCRELLLANTQTVSIADPANQSLPESTSGITQRGTQQLQPAPNFNLSNFPSLSSFSQAFGN